MTEAEHNTLEKEIYFKLGELSAQQSAFMAKLDESLAAAVRFADSFTLYQAAVENRLTKLEHHRTKLIAVCTAVAFAVPLMRDLIVYMTRGLIQ